MNPWHDIHIGDKAPEVVTGIIEITNGSKTKYELDKETGMLRFDRMLYTTMRYPANYGFIPKTYCDDGDPLDILIFSQADFVPMCLVDCRVIGVMHMIDGGEGDDKIIAVPVDDVRMEGVNDISDLPKSSLEEMVNFFEDYKKLQKKETEVNGLKGREEAIKIVQQAMKDYQVKFA